MKLFILTVACVVTTALGSPTPAGCTACPAGKVAAAAGTAGCVDCATITNSATGAVLSCLAAGAQGTASLAAAPALTAAQTANGITNVNAGRKCAPGYFYTAPNGTANATCTACEANCWTCTAGSAGSCTAPKAGYYLNSGTPTACGQDLSAQCQAHATLKVATSAGEKCPDYNSYTAAPDDAAGSSTKGPGCKACPVDDSPKAAGTPGCFNCTAIAGSAAGAVLSCAAEGATGTGVLAAAPAVTAETCLGTATDPVTFPSCTAAFAAANTGTGAAACPAGCTHTPIPATQGRKCAVGKFYVATTNTSNSTCGNCEANCLTCTAAAAGNCTSPAAGFYLNNGVPTACNQNLAAQCSAHATLKVATSDAEKCPAGNSYTAAPDDAAGSSTKGPGCKACPAGDSPKAAGTAGCFDCTAIPGSAAGAVLSCAAEGAAGTGVLTAAPTTGSAAAVGSAVGGRKCALGRFYTAPNGTANATCGNCEANCETCTAGTAGSCTSPAAGYYLNAGVPTACTALTADDCKADAALKIHVSAGAACPAGNVCGAAPSATAITGVSVDANGLCQTATATGSPAGVAVPGTFAALVAAVVAAVRM